RVRVPMIVFNGCSFPSLARHFPCPRDRPLPKRCTPCRRWVRGNRRSLSRNGPRRLAVDPLAGSTMEIAVFDLDRFTLADMYRCSAEVRAVGASAASSASAEESVVAYFFEHLRSSGSQAPACPLVRLFRSTPWSAAPEPARAAVRAHLERE